MFWNRMKHKRHKQSCLAKTKEFIVDSRKGPKCGLSCTDGMVRLLNLYSSTKYLGTVTDESLTFEHQVDAVWQGGPPRHVYFSKTCVSSLFLWNLSFLFLLSLLGTVRMCSQIAGTALNDLLDLHKSRSVQKAQLIRSDPSHPFNTEFTLLPLDTLCQRRRTYRVKQPAL